MYSDQGEHSLSIADGYDEVGAKNPFIRSYLNIQICLAISMMFDSVIESAEIFFPFFDHRGVKDNIPYFIGSLVNSFLIWGLIWLYCEKAKKSMIGDGKALDCLATWTLVFNLLLIVENGFWTVFFGLRGFKDLKEREKGQSPLQAYLDIFVCVTACAMFLGGIVQILRFKDFKDEVKEFKAARLDRGFVEQYDDESMESAKLPR